MRLPEYDPQLTAPAPRTSQVPVLAAGRAGADIAALGAQTAQTFGTIALMEHRADQDNQLTEAVTEARKRLDETYDKLTEDRDYTTKPQRYQEAANQIYSDIRGRLDADTSRRFYDRFMLQSETIGHAVTTMARRERIDFGRAQTEQSNDALLDSAIRAKTPQDRAAALAQVSDNIERGVATGLYTEADGLRLKDKTLGKFEKLQALEYIRTSPARAIAMLDDPNVTKYMDPLERQALKIQAQNRREILAERASRQASEATGVLDAAIRNPDVVKPNIEELRKKVQASGNKRQIQDFEDRAQIFEEVDALSSMPLPKLSAEFDKLREAGVSGKDDLRRITALQLAAARKARALNADAYTAVVKANPELGAALEAAGTDADALRAARQNIIDAQKAEGVPDDRIRLLPKPAATSLERDIAQLQGAERTKKIQSLADAYGDQWDIVKRQLDEGKKLPPDVGVIASLPRRSQAEKVEAERTGTLIGEAFRNTPDKWGELIGKENVKDIADRVASKMADFAKTMAFSPGGQQEAARQVEAVTRLAYLFKFQDESAGDAIEKAKKLVVDDHYFVLDRLRVPKRIDGLPVSETVTGMLVNTAIANIGKLDIDVPPSLYPGVGPDEARKRYIRHIQSQGFAYTSEDGEGFVIMAGPGEPVTIGRGSGMVRVDFRPPASAQFADEVRKAAGPALAPHVGRIIELGRMFGRQKDYGSGDELPSPYSVVPIHRQRYYGAPPETPAQPQ